MEDVDSGEVAKKTDDELQNFIKRIRQLIADDDAHCGWKYMPNRKMIVFWCDMSEGTGTGKIKIMTHRIDEYGVSNKLVCHWLLDSILAEWKNQACSACRECERHREKYCRCMKNKFVRRMANSILKSIGKDKQQWTT